MKSDSLKDEALIYKILSSVFHTPDDLFLRGLSETALFRKALKGASLKSLQAEHTRLFSLTVAGGITPYETEYGHKDIFFKTQRMADIAGFYRAFGFEVADSAHQRVDHIGVELEFMHWLRLKEKRGEEKGLPQQAELCREAAEKFMTDHLGRWGSFFGSQTAESAQHPFYREVGHRLAQFVESECRRLGVTPERVIHPRVIHPGVTGWSPDPTISSTQFECGGCQDVS
ncbi:MAG: molecular chaperone TorD family protein [Deltaproteobacteria bacterium]|nr:molecular chaperone TorD family protein [Deltaproteobacteria bacterium]